MRAGVDFEKEVARVARSLWPGARVGGAIVVDDRERDGVYVTEECVHLIECTTSRKLMKASEDAKKLFDLSKSYQRKHPNKAIKCWFITKDEATADQRTAINKYGDLINCMSLEQFRGQLIDASGYLDLRVSYPYGSVRNQVTGGLDDREFYVPLDILAENGKIYQIDEIAAELESDTRFILAGDYGAGKSTTLRELFLLMRQRFLVGDNLSFPLLLNLRDHAGQTDPVEALERHARKIGYQNPSHLVRAWRAGYAVLLLDGFDELATAGWAGRTKKLKDIRFRSMELIRKFNTEVTDGSGMIISGREHYFDTRVEMRTALSIRGEPVFLTLNDFSEEQLERYLKKHGCAEPVPDWFPRRPLLLAQLAGRGVLADVSTVVESDPAVGWDVLLEKISAREAEIEAGIDPFSLREIIERVATIARRDLDGLGPIPQSETIEAFRGVLGYDPDDSAMVLLQRLPGLGSEEREEGTRRFIDRDFADAARAGDVVRFIENPFTYDLPNPQEWSRCLGPIGVAIATRKCASNGYSEGKIRAAIDAAKQREAWNVISLDLLRVLQEQSYDWKIGVEIDEVFIEDMEIDTTSMNYRGVVFTSCIINNLEVGIIEESRAPAFRSCLFGNVDGRSSRDQLPESVFDADCEFQSFGENARTTAALLHLALPRGAKVALTILKKCFLQSGGGRKESALFRGLGQQERLLVPDVLQLLRREQFLVKSARGGNEIWLPVRSNVGRVKQILAAPMGCKDPVLLKAASLG